MREGKPRSGNKRKAGKAKKSEEKRDKDHLENRGSTGQNVSSEGYESMRRERKD